MKDLKTPVMLLLSCIAVTVGMKVAFHQMGYDEKLQEAAAIAQSLDDPAAGAELLAKEYERTHPGKKLEFKEVPKPVRTIGSFDDYQSSDGYAEQ
jgi:hypothetical protein